MTGDEIRKRLSEIEASECRKLSELAAKIASDSREPVRRLIHSAAQGSDTEWKKVENLLDELRELAVAPCLSARAAGSGERRLLTTTAAARAYLAAQEQVIAKLKRMMESKTTMPPPPASGMTEEKELPSRECDEAYLLARELLKAEDSDLVQLLARREFLLKSPAQRDEEIAKYRKTGKWTPLVEQDPEEAEDLP